MPWPALPPPGYLGQLDPAFQRKMAANRAFVQREDCEFYHTRALPNGEVIRGAWDLRGGESAYLGRVALRNTRVLELGPASGHLTWYMESQGADVVSFDAGWDCCIDLLPRPGVDPESARMEVMSSVGAVQNSWWYFHRELGSSAQVAYGNIYSLPGDLGAFDTSVFGAILLHLRNPFDALTQAAARTTRTMVVTEPFQHPEWDPDDNICRFAPWGVNNYANWWSMTPKVVICMLEALGFPKTTVSYSSHPHHLGAVLSSPPVDMSMFTVVARRE